MKQNRRKLLVALALPLAVGGLGTLLSGGMGNYSGMNQPPLSPPRWVFPVVWTVLYLLMGYSSYRIWQADVPETQKRNVLILYAAQLAANLIWPLFFFGGQLYLAALLWLVLLWVLIFLTIRGFSQIDETAGNLLIPYILWVSFAAYLNFGVFLLN